MRSYNGFNLTKYNSYNLEAICSCAYFPENEQDVRELYSKRNDFILIGSGHNILLTKNVYEEQFIIFNGNFSRIELVNNNVISAEAGATMKDLSLFALDHELTGLEVFYDIPSSVGGAVVMNAGANGEEMKDIVVRVRYLDLADLEVKEISNHEIAFEYRNSFFQNNTDKIVLKVWLNLETKSKCDILHKMEEIKTSRWAKQPKEYPNAGSVFKRPEGKFVGPMIEQLDLKGFSVGGAQISEKHAGFIINFNNATGKDILELIKVVKDKVKIEFNIDLQVEQRII